jgi:outer membrane protein assembly factor BamB
MSARIRIVAALAVMLLGGCQPPARQPDPEPAATTPPLPVDTMYLGGPAHTGAYAGPALRSDPQVLWTYEADGILRSSPAVTGGRIYIGSGDQHLHVLNAATGKIVWQFLTGDEIVSSAALSGVIVTFASLDGFLYGVNILTLEEEWRLDTRNPVYASPTIVNDAAYVGSGTHLMSVAWGSGVVNWDVDLGGTIRSSATVFDPGIVVVGTDSGEVIALEAFTGNELWRTETGGSIWASPAYANGLIVVGSNDQSLYALDAVTGEVRWTFEAAGFVASSAALHEGQVFVADGVGKVYALDGTDGSLIWQAETGGPVYAATTYCDGVVYIASEGSGSVFAFDAATGDELWRFKTGYAGDNRSSSAVLIDGVLYIGSNDHRVYALVAGSE